MDDLVLLTERYGLKPRGKSAPMAVLKQSINTNNNGETRYFFSSGDDVTEESKFGVGSMFDGYDARYLFDVMPESISSSEKVNAFDDLLDDFTGLGPVVRGLGKNEDHHQIQNNRFHVSEAVEAKEQEFGLDDFKSLFIPGPRSSSVPNSWGGSPCVKKKPTAASGQFMDDFFPSFGEVEEVSGESDKRRMVAWEREQIIKNRLANAVSDMNNRDRQIQIEQEERRRIAETLDVEIKLWAAGKEGNMRALLSSLHLILWPGSGWKAVSLTDLITPGAVKKVYKKANLYVHPDKVHQKETQQKYKAEKVFNILQEAWNKFNKEELS